MVDDGHGQHGAATQGNNFNQTTTDLLSSANQSDNFTGGGGAYDGNVTSASSATPLTVISSNNSATRQISGTHQNATNDADKLHRAPLSTIFPASKQSVKTPLISQEKFHWDQVGHYTQLIGWHL